MFFGYSGFCGTKNEIISKKIFAVSPRFVLPAGQEGCFDFAGCSDSLFFKSKELQFFIRFSAEIRFPEGDYSGEKLKNSTICRKLMLGICRTVPKTSTSGHLVSFSSPLPSSLFLEKSRPTAFQWRKTYQNY